MEVFQLQNRPSTSYIIATTGRNGSNLLAQALRLTDIAGKPDEYFLPRMVFYTLQKHSLSVRSLADYTAQLIDKTTTPNGVFGTKMMWRHVDDLVNPVLDDDPTYKTLTFYQRFERLFHQPKYVFMKRRDHIRQAISMRKAQQSDIWFVQSTGLPGHSSRPRAELTFDYYGLKADILNLEAGEERWEAFFRDHNITAQVVFYEDLAAEYERTIQGVLDFLHIERPAGFVVPPPPILKQSDHINDEWYARYHEIDTLQGSMIGRARLRLRDRLNKST